LTLLRGRVYLSVGCLSVCPSVCLSHRSTAATEASGFAAGDIDRQPLSAAIGAGAQQQCGQRHVDSGGTRLVTDLLTVGAGVIAGIAVVVVIFLVIVIALLIVCCLRRSIPCILLLLRLPRDF